METHESKSTKVDEMIEDVRKVKKRWNENEQEIVEIKKIMEDQKKEDAMDES